MTEHSRPRPEVVWATRDPVPRPPIRHREAEAEADTANDHDHDEGSELVFRPDLAHLPGDLTTKVVDGDEYVRQNAPTTRRVLGPHTPFPASKEAN